MDPRPYDARSTDTSPVVTFHPLPSLPLHTQSVMGDVILEAVILADGSICDARVIRGYAGDTIGSEIDSVCVAAVRQWRFRPATRDGTAVSTYETVRISLAACPRRL